MAQQPDLFTPNPRDRTDGPPSAQPGSAPVEEISTRATPWAARLEALVRIIVRLYLGLLVLLLPWLPFWTQNNLFTYDSTLFALASSGFVRGIVSGLGILNIVSVVLDARISIQL